MFRLKSGFSYILVSLVFFSLGFCLFRFVPSADGSSSPPPVYQTGPKPAEPSKSDLIHNSSSQIIADIVEKVGNSVVNIDLTKNVKIESPFKDFEKNFGFGFDVDPQFKNFFEDKILPQHGAGSGFIINKDGYIITNNHVIRGAEKITLTLKDGRKFEGRVVGSDNTYDIAILKVNASNLPVLNLGDSSKIRVGEWVIAIGNPYQFSNSVTVGIVSAMGRSLEGLGQKNLIQTDAAINPGNSGGPLMNLNGEVIGVNVAIAAGAQGIGFAIPINEVKEILNDLLTKGKVSRPWLGIYMRDVDQKIANYLNLPIPEGVIIMDVVKDSPAEKAGIKKYDVIREISGIKIKTSKEVQEMIQKKKPNSDEVSLTIYRDGKLISINSKIGEAP